MLLRYPLPCYQMNFFRILLTTLCLLGSGTVRGEESLQATGPAKEAAADPAKKALPAPVAVPETMAATFLAGVGFLLLFRRRRYS